MFYTRLRKLLACLLLPYISTNFSSLEIAISGFLAVKGTFGLSLLCSTLWNIRTRLRTLLCSLSRILFTHKSLRLPDHHVLLRAVEKLGVCSSNKFFRALFEKYCAYKYA